MRYGDVGGELAISAVSLLLVTSVFALEVPPVEVTEDPSPDCSRKFKPSDVKGCTERRAEPLAPSASDDDPNPSLMERDCNAFVGVRGISPPTPFPFTGPTP